METTKEMKEKLISILKNNCPPLIASIETESNFEVIGNTPTMQGNKKVSGIYFASVVEKPKDVRLYFFPIYTHKEGFDKIFEPLKKCLKGKSCFHFKKIDQELEKAIVEMVKQGILIYKKNKLII